VKNLLKKINANAEHREAGRLLFAHLPSAISDYTIVRLDATTFAPIEGDWMARDRAEERRLVEEVRNRGQVPCSIT
jgi:hypothetical protein